MTETPKRETTARARELGQRLRQNRQHAELSGRALARKVGWPDAKVCQLETGSRPPSSVDVAAFLAGCGPLRRPEYDQLVALAKEPEADHWLRPHSPELPSELRSLIIAESMASTISSFEPLIIPGLLQTERYIRELFHWGSTRPADEIELRVRARVARQALLDQRHLRGYTVFIAEHALRTVVGDMDVMSEQMLHLVFASQTGGCTIRVVPNEAGPFGSVGGMITMLDYREDRPVGYTENPAAGLFVECAAKIRWFREVLSRLESRSLTPERSRAWLVNQASAYDRASATSTGPSASRNRAGDDNSAHRIVAR